MTALVSAVYGGYDAVKPLPAGHGFADAVLVTDRPVDAPGWRVVVEPSGLSPRLAAKAAKALPWRYTDEPDSLWLDAAFEVAPGLAAVVGEHLSRGDLVAWRHPDRDDVEPEAAVSASMAKYAGMPVREQVAAYRAAGLPSPSGLWAAGMLARRHTGLVRTVGAAWLSEMHAWTVQDQLSLPFVLWRHGVTPVAWEGASWWTCGWVRWHAHALP